MLVKGKEILWRVEERDDFFNKDELARFVVAEEPLDFEVRDLNDDFQKLKDGTVDVSDDLSSN